MTDNVVNLFGNLLPFGPERQPERMRHDVLPASLEPSNLRYPALSELRPCGICGGLPIAVTKANDLQCMACGAISQTHEVREV